MKRALAFGLATVYTMGAFCSVFATEMTDDTQTIIADYTVDSSYTVTIPADITFSGFNNSQSINVAASNVFLHNRESLHISMTSENGALVNGGSSVPYTLKVGNTSAVNITNTDTYDLLTVEAGDVEGDSITLVFTSGDDTNVTLAGRHADTLTFSVRPEIASLAGTTWKFNDVVSDYSIFGDNGFDYEAQELNFVARGYMNEESDFRGNVWGFEHNVASYEGVTIEYFSQVGNRYIYVYFPTFKWIDGNTYSGWTFASNADTCAFLDGDMDVLTYSSILMNNVGIEAPIMHFIDNDEPESQTENPAFINWMYKNATLIDTEVLE